MSNKGWVCPKCDTVYSPFVKSCKCSKRKSEKVSKQEHDGWGFDSDGVCIGCGGENHQHETVCDYW